MASGFGQCLRRVREGRSVSRGWVAVRARELGFPKPISEPCIKSIELGWTTPHRLTMIQLVAIFPELPRMA
jgi:hypothetical protein